MKSTLLVMLIFVTFSCSKSATDQPAEKNKPAITIIAPAQQEVYRTGDPLCFKGNVLDESGLKSVTLKLFKADNMFSPVIAYNFPVNERFLYVEQKTIIPSTLNGNCILQFEATDMYNNTAVVTLNFSGN